MKKGVLIVNLGTPDEPNRSAVYRYLKQFLLDRRVIDINWLGRNALVRGIIAPFRSGESAKLYQQLWTKNGSPIKIYGYKLRDEVQKILGENYRVALGMRYQNPSIESAIDELVSENVSEIVIFPLFPQYASATTGSVYEEVMKILSKKWTIPSLRFINSYHDHETMIKIFADNARKFNLDNYDHFIFSYHGLPQRQLTKSDINNHCLKTENCCDRLCEKNQFCYSAQCYATSRAIANELKLHKDNYTVCFQSRLGRDPWTQPYTSEVIHERLAKDNKKLLVFSPAFVADCLETTIEIGHEYKEEFIKKGGEKLDLVPSLNDNPEWIKMVAEMVR